VSSGNSQDAWRDVRISLGPDAEVTGKLSFSDATRLEGKLTGEVRGADLLVIGSRATVDASVQAERLVVLGNVKGDVIGKASVEIRAGGRLVGDVQTKSLVIEEGGVLEGRVAMSGLSSAR
jgi:cytoskeletal protein CcmA (bactofilin family)